MKLQGFIGPAYQLKSVAVDAQRCVNLYPETIESGMGKGQQVAYLRSTPGLTELFLLALARFVWFMWKTLSVTIQLKRPLFTL